MNKTTIVVKNLKKHYDDGRIKALDGVNLEIKPAEFLAIMGPSGSGKSTLLHLLGGFDRPTSGRITVGGLDLGRELDLNSYRSEQIGFVFQLHNLLPGLSAEENVLIPTVNRPGSSDKRREAVELLSLVGLSEKRESLPPKLSGGERQRVAVARALINQPKIIIADEPTGALDSKSSRQILELLKKIHLERRPTIIMVTHDRQVARSAERIVLMLDGKIKAKGSRSKKGASGGDQKRAKS